MVNRGEPRTRVVGQSQGIVLTRRKCRSIMLNILMLECLNRQNPILGIPLI